MRIHLPPPRRTACLAFAVLGFILLGSARAAAPAADPEDGLSPRWRRLAKAARTGDRRSSFRLALAPAVPDEEGLIELLRGARGVLAVRPETAALTAVPGREAGDSLGARPLAVYPDLTVDAAGGNSPYSVTASATYGNVYDGNTSTGVINQSAGTLTANTAFYVGNNASSNGTYNLTGGSLAVTGASYIGYNGTGSFVQNGTSSVTTTTGSANGSIYLGYNAGSVGTYSLADSATLNVAFGLFDGYSSAGANTFTQSGGTAILGSVDLGVNKGSNGTFNLSGGTLSSGNFVVGDLGTGIVNQTGGSLTISSNRSMILGNNSNSSNQTSSSGTYNLSGGSASLYSLYLGYSNNYFNAGNFVQSGASTVSASGYVYVGFGAASTGTYSLADTASITSPTLTVGYNSSMNNTFTQTGGMASFTTAAYLGYNTSSKGTVNLSGGTFSTPSLYDGDSGVGVFMQSGASTVTTTTLHLGPNGQFGTAAYNVGTYSLAGTGTLTGATLYIGETSPGANAFTQSGASANFSSAIYLGYNTGSVGTLNLSGGTLTSGGSISVGYNGTGTVNQSGGTLTVGSGGSLAMGVLGNSSSGTYNLSGGTLAAPSVNGAVGSTFNFNGGTLQATADSTAFFSVSATNVQAGGAVIDTNGHTVTSAQALAHDGSLGATADGGLQKKGLGTLTLTGGSGFTGPVRVNAGTLALNAGTGQALSATGSVTVNPGGTLLLGAANQINNAAALVLNANSGPAPGATVAFNTAGVSQTLGALTLSSTSVIDLGSGASLLHFANSGTRTWTGTLAVWNWTGTAVAGGGADELIFGANAASLSNAQLADIQFYSDSGTTLLAAAGFAGSNTGEVVPGGMLTSAVPEPATSLGGALLVGSAAGGFLRRARRRVV